MWEWVRGFRWRGADDDGDLARPDRPSRCTLPITALRLTLPSSAAIWLAESPASQSFVQLLDASMGPGQNRHFTLPSHRGGQFLEPRDDAKLQKTAPSESLKARRAQKARPNFYTGYLGREDWTCHAMSSDKLNLQFSWTLAQGYSWFKLYALFSTGYIG